MANNFANDPDVVALYRFESGALTTDSSGNGNTLTNVNTVEENTTDYQEGSCCADLEYSSSEYFYRTDTNLASNFPFKSGTTNKAVTVCCWIRLESETSVTYERIFSKYDTTLNKRSISGLYDKSSDAIRLALGYNSGQSAEVVTHGSGLSIATWYHVTWSYDDSDKSYAIRIRDEDGDVVGADLTGKATLDANKISLTDSPFQVGAGNDNGSAIHFFDGLIDELVVFKRVLSATEITAIAKGQYKSYEESVSDLFKASDSQASLLKLEFANSDSFKLSEGILANAILKNSPSDILSLSELSSFAKGAIESVSDLFKLSESLSPYQQEVMKDSPAVYYRLGELEGSIAYDSSGNGKHLSYSESGVTKGANGLVAGNNKAALFNGSSRANESNYNPGGKTAITLEAWCKASVLNESHNIVFGIGTTGHYISLINFGENTYTLFSIRVSEIQKLLYCYNKVMSVDEVYHIVATWESGDYQRVYLNGVELGRSASIVSGTLNSSAGVELAAIVNSYFFNGAIDEVAVYETALSPERVAAHYRAGKIGEAPVINFIESVSDGAVFIDSSTGTLIIPLSVEDAVKLLDSSEIADGVYMFEVSDFLSVNDSSTRVAKVVVAVSDKFKTQDASTISNLSDAIKSVVKLKFRKRDFLTFKKGETFTFKNRTSFFTTKKE